MHIHERDLRHAQWGAGDGQTLYVWTCTLCSWALQPRSKVCKAVCVSHQSQSGITGSRVQTVALEPSVCS